MLFFVISDTKASYSSSFQMHFVISDTLYSSFQIHFIRHFRYTLFVISDTDIRHFRYTLFVISDTDVRHFRYTLLFLLFTTHCYLIINIFSVIW